MTVERRKFKRHEVSESGYFVFDHDTSEMARIKDISLGGLKFEYERRVSHLELFKIDCKMRKSKFRGPFKEIIN
jgi:hypothetical protein